MSEPKPARRKSGKSKLEPIDWHELANDAVLNGNMSTLYHRPQSEDPSTYASEEALREIEKRAPKPTVGPEPPVDAPPTGSVGPTAGIETTVGAVISPQPTVAPEPIEGPVPTVGPTPAVGWDYPKRKRIKPIRDVQDALTLAGQVLYKAMYGAPDGARAKSCSKGYRQLAAETHLDKDTVRDLIADFKDKGMVHETGAYNPDTRSPKTYEVLSYKAILQVWREAGLLFVTPGRRPQFCDVLGRPVGVAPTMGPRPPVGADIPVVLPPTVGLADRSPVAELLEGLQQITGGPVDQEAAERLLAGCRAEAPDCAAGEILEFAWSKAFLCRSGKIDNPVGFLITQVPKHFQGEAFQAYREARRQELEQAARTASREERQRQAEVLRQVQLDQKHRERLAWLEQFRGEAGIDLRAVERAATDEVLKDWARRMQRLGHRYRPHYD